ncbi:hypothetical protein PV325_013349, partial [Microctonus aethiopoides]
MRSHHSGLSAFGFSRKDTRLELAINLIDYEAARKTIYRARNGLVPTFPKTLRELVDGMGNIRDDIKEAYYSYFRTEEDKIGVVFTSDKLLNALGNADTKEIYIDGTFAARPNPPKSEQILVVHVKRRVSSVPVLLVLCENRTKNYWVCSDIH